MYWASTEKSDGRKNVFSKPSVNFQIFPPGAMAKELDEQKMKEFIHGHLFFAKFDKVEDVELNDREAYTEYKVKKRNWDGPMSLEFFTSSLKLRSFF